MFSIEDGILLFSGGDPGTEKEAWKITLAKWRTLLQEATDGRGIVDGGPTTCGLCMLYIAAGCIDCPIQQYTGRVYCQGTPYESYNPMDVSVAELAEAAQLELDFLIEVKG